MAELTIRKFPDSVLRKKAATVERVGESERNILSDMATTMYLNNGVGLAAVQVGIDKQLAVIDVGDGLVKMVNPRILKREGGDTQEEGCLSVSDVKVMVKRAKRVIVSFLKEDGTIGLITADGLFARAVQHEIDHLSGKLIIDYMNPLKKIFLKKRLTKS